MYIFLKGFTIAHSIITSFTRVNHELTLCEYRVDSIYIHPSSKSKRIFQNQGKKSKKKNTQKYYIMTHCPMAAIERTGYVSVEKGCRKFS